MEAHYVQMLAALSGVKDASLTPRARELSASEDFWQEMWKTEPDALTEEQLMVISELGVDPAALGRSPSDE